MLNALTSSILAARHLVSGHESHRCGGHGGLSAPCQQQQCACQQQQTVWLGNGPGEGAGVHHNPTPGPADGKWLYGHNWVALAWLATHPVWGVIAMPLRSMLYVREVDVPKLAEKYDWKFRTKHQLGVER